MAITLRARGQVEGLERRITARATRVPVSDVVARRDYALLLDCVPQEAELDAFDGYAAVVTPGEFPKSGNWAVATPLVSALDTGHIKDGHIVTIEPRSGFVMTVYRPESRHNTIFTTERCNSNCLMCSQPPKDVDDSFRVQEHLRTLSLIESPPDFLCITGGEPTLLGPSLLVLLEAIRTRFPSTSVQMLTNGRTYRDAALVREIAATGLTGLTSAIPLYADVAPIHDYIVQAEGAFDETVEGLYNAAEAGLRLEIRVVLHKQSIPRLRQLVEFIYRNFPFVSHVALMGLENMGYVKKNWDLLWIDPVSYMDELEAAVTYLWRRRMNVSLYNLQLCLLPEKLWFFARRSISDYKNIYIGECSACTQRENCAGLFSSQLHRHSAHIRPIP